MLGKLPLPEMREVLRHLLGRCSRCGDLTQELWSSPRERRPLHQTGQARPAAVATLGQASAKKPRPSSRPGRDTALHSRPGRDPAGQMTRPTAVPAYGNGTGAAEAPGREQPDDKAYDAVLDRVFARVLAQEARLAEEQARGRELFAELMGYLPTRQSLLVANSVRFRDRTVCECLIAESHEQGFNDPARSLELARLAVSAATALSAESCGGGEMLHSLQARAWAQLGNALRIRADYTEAERAFAVADSLLAEDPRINALDVARVLDQKASLSRRQLQYAEACRLLDRVIAIYRKLGQWNLLGRAFYQKSVVYGEAGDTDSQMKLLRSALDLLDPNEDPRLFLYIRHSLILALTESGRAREAFALLFHTRPQYLKMGDRGSLVSLRWLEGKVAMGMQRTEQAEAAFREVRDASVELGQDYDAALAALDLASVYALQGRAGELRLLAAESLAIFQSRQIHREAMAALLVFHSAAEMEQAELALVHEVATFLKRARNNPSLQFRTSQEPRLSS